MLLNLTWYVSEILFFSVSVCTISLFMEDHKILRNMQRLTQKNIYSVSVLQTANNFSICQRKQGSLRSTRILLDTVPLWLPKRKPQRQKQTVCPKRLKEAALRPPCVLSTSGRATVRELCCVKGQCHPLQPVLVDQEAPVSWSIPGNSGFHAARRIRAQLRGCM